MEIEVDNVVKVKADITINQVRKYLVNHGWELVIGGHIWEVWQKEFNGREDSASIPMREDYNDFTICLARTVHEIASHENRKPGDVILDIAKEPIIADFIPGTIQGPIENCDEFFGNSPST